MSDGRTGFAFASTIRELKALLLSCRCGVFVYECQTQHKSKELQMFWWHTSVLVVTNCRRVDVQLAKLDVSHVYHFCSTISACRTINEQNSGRSSLQSCRKGRCRGKYCCHTCNWRIVNNTAPSHPIIIITSTYSYIRTRTHTHIHTSYTHARAHLSKCEDCWRQASNPMPKEIRSVCFGAG